MKSCSFHSDLHTTHEPELLPLIRSRPSGRNHLLRRPAGEKASQGRLMERFRQKRFASAGALWFVILAMMVITAPAARAQTCVVSGRVVTDDLYDIPAPIAVPGVAVTVAQLGGGAVVATATTD